MEPASWKKVTVLVERKARFDEDSHIRWAKGLQEAGVRVYHWHVGLKAHCKLALLVWREPDGKVLRYAHLGTGNYNPTTAQFYTDLSLLTQDAEITKAVHHVFNFLTAYPERPHFGPFLVAPLNLGKTCVSLKDRKAEHTHARRPALVVAKPNSLLEKCIIHAQYRASRAGVNIELIIRGACALRPGVRRLSNRIHVRGIVGRFLEHRRTAILGIGGQPEVYWGGAEWMQRNLYEHAEVKFRLKDSVLCRKACKWILGPSLADVEESRHLGHDGCYVESHGSGRPRTGSSGARFSAREADLTRFIAKLAELLSLRCFDARQFPEVFAHIQ